MSVRDVRRHDLDDVLRHVLRHLALGWVSDVRLAPGEERDPGASADDGRSSTKPHTRGRRRRVSLVESRAFERVDDRTPRGLGRPAADEDGRHAENEQRDA